MDDQFEGWWKSDFIFMKTGVSLLIYTKNIYELAQRFIG